MHQNQNAIHAICNTVEHCGCFIILGDFLNSTSIMELQVSALLGFSFGVLNIIFDAEYVLHVD